MSQRAFTLIELLVTLSVLAVVLMLAAPNFGQLLRNNQANAELMGLSDMLNYARREAAQSARQVKLQGPLAADGAWQLLRSSDGRELRHFNALSSFTVDPSGVQSIEFDTQGRLVSGARRVFQVQVRDTAVLDCARYNRTVSVELSGSISLTKGGC